MNTRRRENKAVLSPGQRMYKEYLKIKENLHTTKIDTLLEELKKLKNDIETNYSNINLLDELKEINELIAIYSMQIAQKSGNAPLNDHFVHEKITAKAMQRSKQNAYHFFSLNLKEADAIKSLLDATKPIDLQEAKAAISLIAFKTAKI